MFVVIYKYIELWNNQCNNLVRTLRQSSGASPKQIMRNIEVGVLPALWQLCQLLPVLQEYVVMHTPV